MINRIKGKVLLVILLFLFGITNVSALTKNIEVKDLSVKDKSGTITVVDPVLVSNEVTSNITFNQKDDFVTFELTLKNNESEKYKVTSITDNNTNENLKTEYSFSEDYMNTGDTSKVTIKLTYKKQLLNVDQISLSDLTIKIALVNEDGDSEDIIINPTTGDNILHYLVLLIIAITGLILIAKKKKIFRVKVGNLLIVFAIIMIPFAAIAKEQYEINIKFNDIIVKGEFETYSITIDPKNGNAPTVKDITYGQKIGDLPTNPTKDGYTFDKWVDGEGNEVTKDTVINGPIEVIATYNLVTYNISYDLDDGSLPSGKSNPTEYTIESQSITLNNPEKRGYTFAGWSGTGIYGQTTEVTIGHGSKGDRTYTANYLAKDDTKYTVIHKFQKLTEGYDEETVEEHGTTGSTVPAPRKTRTGFITPTVQNVYIEADGSAEITYTYERETYSFSITDRTYIDESVSTPNDTYPYETSITVKALNRPGYDFKWSDGDTNLERTFTLENEKELTPEYTARTDTAYKVIHQKQKITLDGYEIEDTQNLTGTTDSPISPAVNTYEGFTSPQVQSTTINGDGSTVVNYYYTRNQVTVTFTNTEYIEEDVTSGLHYYGEQITLTAKDRDGYTFTGWTNGETSNPLTITVGTSDVSVGPEYTAKTNTPYVVNHYKMNLDGENYTKVEDDTQNLTGTTDATITPAVNTYDGFTSPSTQTTTISGKGDTVVNYYYTRNKYTLTINHPEYLEEDKSGEYYYEEEITLTAIDRQGYTFAGWNTGETTKTIIVSMPVDGITEEATYTSNTDTTYSVTHKYKKLTEGYDEVTINGTGTTGDTIEAPLRPQTGFVNPTVQNITITADGEANVVYTYQRETYTFSITDRTYLDSTSTANNTYPYGTTITLKAIEREGYSFKWSDNVTDYERTFELESNVTDLSLIYTANTYTLTADANEGTIEETTGWTGTGETATKTITYDSTYGTLPTVEREGYTLAGWNTAEDGTGTDITSSTTVSTLTNQAIYAQWIINSYSVTFDTDGGSVVTGQTVNHGGHATRPAVDPEKEGFEFNGWYTTDEYETEFDFENTSITSATIIYAKFIEIDPCIPFATDSWSTIKTNIESDSNYYPIGCTKEVEIDMNDDSTPESYTVRLANTSSPSVCSTSGYSKTACGTVIEFIDVIDMMPMNSSNENAGGWRSTEVATYLNSDFYNKLPSDLKAVMIPTYPMVSGSGSGNDSPNVTAEDINVNKLYLLSLKEAGIDYFYDNKKDVTTDTRILDFYTQNTDKESKIKTDINNAAKIWWTRSASSENTFYFLTVTANGNNGGSAASTSQGVAPAFRIGTMPEFTVSFNTTGSSSSVDSQTITYGESAIRPSTNPTPPSGKIFYNWYTDDSYTTVFDFTKPITGDTTIYARFDVDCLGFDTASWSTIKTNIENDSDYYPIGCQKEVEMDIDEDGVDESYTVRLANTSTPEVCSTEGYSQTACGTVIEFVDIAGTYVWNVANTAAGGWKNSAIASYLNSDFYNKLPSDLKAVMKPTYPIVSGSCNDNNSPDITVEDTNLNKLYLLSAREVGYDLSTDNKKNVLTDTRTLDYYEINSGEKDKQKQLDGTNETWWLRTPTKGALAICNSIYSSGTSVEDYCRKEHGIAPAFRIGTEVSSKYTVTFDTDGGSEVSSQTVSSGGTATRPTTDPEKTGFVFDDWYTTDQYTTKYDFTTPITGDTTIYAKFDELKTCAGNENVTRLSENTCSANENITVGDGIVCKRAVKLHEETCSQTSNYCNASGYTPSGSKGTDTITYGSCGTSGTLTNGDAFTCDVNGDGDFDELTERFYYISDYYNTSTKEFDDSTAVLIYYNNVTDGVSCNKNTYAYDSNNDNWKGPRTLTLQLPTTSQWSNVSLKSTSRQILTNLNTTSTSGGALPEFDYSGYAARFITAQELNSACGISVGALNNGELDSCNYVLENTKYAKAAVGNNGYWLESTYQNDDHVVWRTTANRRYVFYDDASYAVNSGARPVIEVPKTAINIGDAPQYTISFDEQGGDNVNDITVDSGDSIDELPTPTRTDYYFLGWYEDLSDTDPVSEPYTPSGNIELIAKWQKIVCKKATTLTETECHSNSGYGCRLAGYTDGDKVVFGNVVSSDTYNTGDALLCDVDGTGYNTRFYYMRTLDDRAVLISANIMVAAGDPHDTNYLYDAAKNLLPTSSEWSNLPVTFENGTKAGRFPTLEDSTEAFTTIYDNNSLKDYPFIFEDIGKYNSNDGRSTVWINEVDSSNRYRYHINTNNVVKVTDNISNSKNCVKPVIEVPLYLIEDAYIVRFDANGGEASSEYAKVLKGDAIGTLPTATNTGVVFEGWYTSLQYTEPVTTSTVPSGYVTYFAKWAVDISDATFGYDSFVMEIGDEDDIVITTPDVEPVTYTSNDDSIVIVDSSGHLLGLDVGETTITVTGTKSGHTRTINVKVMAEITDFTVHFDSQGGSSVDDMFVPKNTAIGSFPADPVYSGYIFAGWFTNTNYSTQVTIDTVIKSEVTFFAKWIPEDAVAEINHTYFNTLQGAVDSEMTEKTTIVLLKDITINTYINLYTKNTNKDVVLDLNNHTITGTSGQTIRTKTSLEIKNGTVTQSSSNGTIDVGAGGHLIINSGRIENSGGRAAIYNDSGTVELGGTVYITTNAEFSTNASYNRASVQNKSGTTIITGGTYINTRSTNSYAVSATAGTLVIGTKDDIYNTTNIVIQGETGGIYSAVNYSLYDGMVKGITAAVNDESKITSIEDNATKVNDVDGNYNILYYTVPLNKYRIDLDAGDGTVDPTFILVDAGDQLGTLPTPTRGVYTFDGWFDANDVAADPTHEPTSNETYYAKWHYEASNEIVEFRTTNDAMVEYYDKIETWKVSSANFPSWNSSNKSPDWALDATENTAMKNNFDANNCECADGQCTSSGTVACDKPKGYATGLNEQVNVYLSDAITKAKGDLVTYAKANNGVIYNLIPGEVYYWESNSDSNIHGYVRFTGERRILDTGDVRNTRDLGGLPVDTDSDGTIDGELKYGKLFRGIKLNSSSSVTELANLGITEELDLREANSDPYKLSDLTGKKYHRIEAQNYYVNYNLQNQTEMNYYNMTRAAVKYAMEEIVNGENLYFHCRIGTDRTGTVAYVLEGLLGVPEEDRIQDYELSFFYGLIRIHRYHNEKPGSSVGTGKERFVYMHNFMPTNSDIYDWYMAGSDNTASDQALINSFRNKMINSY